MKLKYYIDKGRKIYTLKDKIGKSLTHDAHHKYLGIRSAKTTSSAHQNLE